MSNLERLARPFPAKYIQAAPQGKHGDYVGHPVVNQAALAIVGPFSWKVREFIYDPAGLIVGCVGSLTCTIDGATVTVEEVGDTDDDRGNKVTNNGARAKNVASDAFKRCWMRVGLGLHLWSKDGYFLYDNLKKRGERGEESRDSERPEETS